MQHLGRGGELLQADVASAELLHPNCATARSWLQDDCNRRRVRTLLRVVAEQHAGVGGRVSPGNHLFAAQVVAKKERVLYFTASNSIFTRRRISFPLDTTFPPRAR